MYNTLNKQTSFFVALSLVLVLFSTCKKDDGECNTANVPTIEWQKTIGDNDTTAINSVQQTNDGGYILAGYKNNSPNRNDYWIAKLNNNADIEWEKTYGGSSIDEAQSIQQTTDGGYIVAGSTFSHDGDVTNNNGGNDAWILKLTTNGDIEWQKTYGGSADDYLNSIKQTTDGGYIAVGGSNSNNGDIPNNQGYTDAWIIKIDTNGNIEWSKTFGGNASDGLVDIQQTTNGGYLTVGVTQSTDGWGDYLVIKLQTNGNLEWQKTYGSIYTDIASCIQKTNDGHYLLVGYSNSNDGTTINPNGNSDALLIKIDNLGNILQQTSVGTNDSEVANNILQTHDNNFLIVGYSLNYDSNTKNIFIAALNANYTLLWQWQKPQDIDISYANFIFETPDCGYMLFGGKTVQNGINNTLIIKLK